MTFGFKALRFGQDRTPDVIADVLQLLALDDTAHAPILSGILHWQQPTQIGALP